MGTYGLATTAAPIIAPTIAGLMIDAFGWKSIFYVVLVIMAFSFILSAVVFEDVLELQDKKFDFISFVESIIAFGGAFGGITLGIGNLTSFGLISIEGGLPLAVGIVVCIFFAVRQWGLEKPFLDVKILKNKNYAISVISSMLLYLVMMGSSVMMPLYVQSVMGYSAVVSGLVTLPGSLATAVISPLAGKMYDKMGIKKLFVIGSAVFVGIMTVVSESSAAAYGDRALIHGMNISFLWMAAGALILLLISIFGVRKNLEQKGRPY